MSTNDPVALALEEVGHPAGADALRALDELLARSPEKAGPFADALTPRLAKVAGADAGRATLALGSAQLVLGDARLARELLIEAAALAPPDDRLLVARAGLRLASAELALGNARGARLHASRAFPVAVAAPDLQDELGRVLERAGETLAAQAVAELARRGDGRGGDRVSVLARLVATLNSCAAGTAEPLFSVLRAVIEETRAERGFLMLYEGATLRFELGLSRSGRRIAEPDFACSTTIVERALESGGAVLVPDLAADLPFALASSARSLGLRSALCAPLRVERRRSGAAASVAIPNVKGIAGVLYVDSTATTTFEADDARFFEALADAAVLALRAAGGRPAQRPPERPAEATRERTFGPITTRAPAMRAALDVLERVVATDASVVLRGESGAGKELFARALHDRGRRAKGPFVVLECGAIPESLVHHELFGHEEGAFTGAGSARAGLIERAHGGTLFLDEVADMPAAMQAALLRVLQEGEVRRIGGDKPRPVDVRLVASTQRDLASLVERGELRQDLLFRLAVVELRVPPLRERREDLPLLVEQLLARLDGGPRELDPAALARLEEHGWPGNVRELENVLRAAAVVARGDAIGLADVEVALGRGEKKKGAPAPAVPDQGALAGTLEELERRAIVARLDALGWNQLRVSESLGIDRTTLRRKMTRYGIVRGRE